MSQPTSSSSPSPSLGPIQLGLFVGKFDGPRADGAVVANPALNLAGVEPSPAITGLLGSEAVEFMQVFESVSGWEVHFQESADSNQRRVQDAGLDGTSADQSLWPLGEFKIIDMSAHWPAMTPAMHRGKCDQLIKLYSDLYRQANASQDDLDKVQGLLVALTSPAKDGEQWIDSFAPVLAGLDDADGSDFALDQGSGFGDESESAFVVKQEFDARGFDDGQVWGDWSFAGATGIVGETYLDWAQRGDTLTVYVGRIESSFGAGDTESSLEVNAVSRQFKVSEANTLAAFFLWDRRGGRLRSVEPGSWQTLYPQGAIVISTDPDVQMPDSVVNAQPGAKPFTTQQLATAIEARLGEDHRVLVIQCG